MKRLYFEILRALPDPSEGINMDEVMGKKSK